MNATYYHIAVDVDSFTDGHSLEPTEVVFVMLYSLLVESLTAFVVVLTPMHGYSYQQKITTKADNRLHVNALSPIVSFSSRFCKFVVRIAKPASVQRGKFSAPSTCLCACIGMHLVTAMFLPTYLSLASFVKAKRI